MAGADDSTEPAARKVQRTGGSTFTVSLPKDWATAQGLSAGSTVYLYPFEDRVVVAPGRRQRVDRRVELDVTGLDPDAVAETVRGAYAAGFDTIAVTGGNDGLADGLRSAAADALTGLVGMQIVEEGPDKLAARCTLDAAAVSLDQTLAQVRQQTLSAMRGALRALIAADEDAGRATATRVEEVERLVALVERQFQSALVDVREIDQLDGDRAGAYRQVTMAQSLADAAAAAADLASVASEQSSSPSADVGSAFMASGDAVRRAIRVAIGEDRAGAREAVRAASAQIGEVDDRLACSTAADAHRYGRALAALSRATEAAEELATIRIDDVES